MSDEKRLERIENKIDKLNDEITDLKVKLASFGTGIKVVASVISLVVSSIIGFSIKLFNNN